MPEEYPRLIHWQNDNGYGGYTVIGLRLPSWFAKKHAKLVYENVNFRNAIEREAVSCAKAFGTSAIYEKYNMTALDLMWCECCGLSFVNYRIGDATSLGISGHQWDEASEWNDIDSHNIDTLAQLVTLYSVWVYYLNSLELMKDDWNKSGPTNPSGNAVSKPKITLSNILDKSF
jgi:hypothetical protein